MVVSFQVLLVEGVMLFLLSVLYFLGEMKKRSYELADKL